MRKYSFSNSSLEILLPSPELLPIPLYRARKDEVRTNTESGEPENDYFALENGVEQETEIYSSQFHFFSKRAFSDIVF
jgi:hypothetical protein